MASHAKSDEVSHGVGGAGNINLDNTQYADGEIVRQGVVSDHGEALLAGRGGAGNIQSPEANATNLKPEDADLVPESAMRPSSENYHVGRGGQGNVHKEPVVQVHEGLADKLKNKLMGRKKGPK